ncbi:vegetative cell wall protein gp1-like [Choloepus didactylus]|uniref:vegetative cell wall protein gp1-like n=1 Tax=Choloepus didactylus TaxID=27675 RepID=UPI00189DE5A7|nr:vegetative cell wall protein gp1-like [Choloepus didactylus]
MSATWATMREAVLPTPFSPDPRAPAGLQAERWLRPALTKCPAPAPRLSPPTMCPALGPPPTMCPAPPRPWSCAPPLAPPLVMYPAPSRCPAPSPAPGRVPRPWLRPGPLRALPAPRACLCPQVPGQGRAHARAWLRRLRAPRRAPLLSPGPGIQVPASRGSPSAANKSPGPRVSRGPPWAEARPVPRVPLGASARGLRPARPAPPRRWGVLSWEHGPGPSAGAPRKGVPAPPPPRSPAPQHGHPPFPRSPLPRLCILRCLPAARAGRALRPPCPARPCRPGQDRHRNAPQTSVGSGPRGPTLASKGVRTGGSPPGRTASSQCRRAHVHGVGQEMCLPGSFGKF